MRVRSKILFATLLMVTVQAAAFPQGWHASATSRPSEELKVYVRNYLGDFDSSRDLTTKIKVVRIMATNGKAQDLVYISARDWCGTGGCRLLILEPAESTFKMLGSETAVKLPIKLLRSMNNGRPDILVTMRGTGVLDDEAVLSFDGEKYPSNPTVPPARKATAVGGKVIMANTDGGVPLYD